MKYAFILLALFCATESFAASSEISVSCSNSIKSQFKLILDKTISATELTKNSDSPNNIVDIVLSQRHPQENYCVKAASAKVEYNDKGECQVIELKIDPGHFDCG